MLILLKQNHNEDKMQIGLVLLCCLLTVIVQMSATIYLPALIHIQSSLGMSNSTGALSISLFVLFSAFGQLLFCGISDIIGRKKIIVSGLIVAVAATLLAVCAPNGFLFVLFRCIDGLAVGAIISTSRAVLNDTHSGEALISAIALSAIVASCTSMVSPLIGAILFNAFNAWISIFIVLSAVGTILLLLAIFKLPETNMHIKTGEKKALIKPLTNNLKEVLTSNKKALAFMLSCSFSFAILFTYYVASPFIFENGLGLSVTDFSVLFLFTSGAFIAGSILGKLLSKRFSQKSIITIDSYIIVIDTICFIILYGLNIYNIGIMLTFIIIIALMVGMIFPLGMSKGISYYKHLSGSAAAIMGFLQMGCSAIGMIVMSFLPKDNPLSLSYIILVLGIIIVLLMNTWAREKDDFELSSKR